MNPIKSIDARWKNYQLRHFEKTKYGKKLQTLHNQFIGRRCFIVGNGPSLTVEDLEELKNEYTFGFNRIYHIFSHTAWRPTFYCTQDTKIVQNSLDEIRSKIDTPYIFAPINLKWYYGLDLETEYYFNQRPAKSENECPDFCENIPHAIGVGNTVAYTAMQLAVYMGFREIYLIGVDHSFHISQDKDGNVVVDPNVKDYFCKEYNQDKDELFIPKLDVSTLAYMSAQEYAQHHDVNIFNATRGGKLEVFPRVVLDELF